MRPKPNGIDMQLIKIPNMILEWHVLRAIAIARGMIPMITQNTENVFVLVEPNLSFI